MYRTLPATKHVASNAGRGLVRVTRRRLTTEAPPPPQKKKRGVVSRIFLYTTAVTGTFYIGSTFVSFKHQPYYDFFSDHVPLGQSFLEYAEAHNWDTFTPQKVLDSGRNVVSSAQKFITDKINGSPSAHDTADKVKHTAENIKHSAEQKAHDAKVAAVKIIHDSESRVKDKAVKIRKEILKEEDKLTGKAKAISRHQSQQFNDELVELIRNAEAALAGDKSAPETSSTLGQPGGSPPSLTPQQTHSDETANTVETDKSVYDAPLPLGFEPPPGYSRPTPKKETPKPEPPTSVLPLVAPAVAELTASEPIVSHLASTIDDLASYLKANPDAAARAKGILETAKEDLTSLVSHIDKVKEEERTQLERKLNEQTREYTDKLLELEMEAQDKLDSQEEAFRKFYDEERLKFAQAYREKLEQELRTQTELINERLKEQVIAQGIELQRRWIREIKVRVEQERGGRLAKLEELSANIKRLEQVTIENSHYLDENIRLHALWSAIRALSNSIDSPVRKPFRDELHVLRHITAAREDPVISSVLETLEHSDVPDIGVEPFADLASWFTTSVAPKLCNVALVPDQNAGVLSHMASHLLSSFRFRRHGMVPGNDVLSVLARAEYYLNEKDLDSAARELNQLKGTAKVLLHDWLEAARRRLEVEQAREVIQTQATLASLLVV